MKYRSLLSVLIVFLSFSGFGQKTITGTVVDGADDSGLPGVTVLIKGTLNGTVTDFDGNFSLQVTEGDILSISYVGFQSQEILVGSSSVINVALLVDAEELEEVVIIGYGKVESKDVTGVVNKVDAKTFNKGVLSSPDALINGKVAGVNMTSTGGEPGAQINIRIRGGTSLSASNQPLFVVDGIPLDSEPSNFDGMAGGRNPLNFINPSDIQDITVLKDASASAIYGSRGANGVIIITTKSGGNGKLELTYDGNFTVTTFQDPGNFLTREEFVFTMERRAPAKLGFLGEADTDWVEEVTRNSTGINHNLSASFGNSKRQVRISGNYQKLNGILETSSTERIAASINATQKLLSDDLTITLNTKHSINNDRFAPGVINSAFSFDPTQTVTSDDPTFGGYYEHPNPLAAVNPVSQIEQTWDVGKSSRNLISLKLDYNLPFLEGVSINTNSAIDLGKEKRQFWQPETLKSSANPNGELIYVDDETTSRIQEVYLNYSKQLDAYNLQMDYTAGYSYQDWEKFRPNHVLNDTTISTSLGIGISEPIGNGEFSRIRSSLIPRDNAQFTLETRFISFWGRANFSLNFKYLLTATLRRDGSTRFAESNQWGIFPSLALGWRIMDEPFMDPLRSIFSDLKIRYGWGITGSQEIQDYRYVTTYTRSQAGAQIILGDEVITGLRPIAVDPNIKWEETTSSNLGIDFEITSGRLYGSLDLYEKETDDLLLVIPVSAGSATGGQVLTNVGAVRNRGLEILLNTIAIDKNDWKLSLNFNAATNKNEVTKITEGDGQLLRGIIGGAGFGSQIQVLREGQPANSFYVYEHKKDAAGNPLGDGDDNNGDGFVNDLDIYEDQITLDTDDDGIADSPDGVINENDRVIKGKPWPDWTFGLTSNLEYKKFDLSMTIRSQIGAEVYNNIASSYGAYLVADGLAPTNIHRSAYENDFRNQQVFSEIYVESADFLRLDNISLGFTHQFSSKFRMRTYITTSNVLLITGYSGADPEAGPSSSASQEDRNSFGIDNNLYPRGRTFLLGVNINF